MKKMVVAMAVIWSVVALLLTSIVISQVVYFGNSSSGSRSSSYSSSHSSRESQVYLEQSYPVSAVDSISVNLSSEEVEILETDEADIRIKHLGRDLKEEQMLEISQTGGVLEIRRRNFRSFSFGFFSFPYSFYSKVEVYLPKDYAPNFSVDMSSGDVVFSNPLSFNRLDLELSSGRIRSNYALNCNEANLELSSGTIRLDGLHTERFAIDVSSGTVDLNALTGAGEIELTSGKIRANSVQMQGDLQVDVSSGTVQMHLLGNPSLQFTGEISSGSIKTYFQQNRHGDHERSMSATVGDGPYHRLDIGVTSGNVNIQRQGS